MHQSCFSITKLVSPYHGLGHVPIIIGSAVRKEIFALKFTDNECCEKFKVKRYFE